MAGQGDSEISREARAHSFSLPSMSAQLHVLSHSLLLETHGSRRMMQRRTPASLQRNFMRVLWAQMEGAPRGASDERSEQGGPVTITVHCPNTGQEWSDPSLSSPLFLVTIHHPPYPMAHHCCVHGNAPASEASWPPDIELPYSSTYLSHCFVMLGRLCGICGTPVSLLAARRLP